MKGEGEAAEERGIGFPHRYIERNYSVWWVPAESPKIDRIHANSKSRSHESILADLPDIDPAMPTPLILAPTLRGEDQDEEEKANHPLTDRPFQPIFCSAYRGPSREYSILAPFERLELFAPCTMRLCETLHFEGRNSTRTLGPDEDRFATCVRRSAARVSR
ncbi:hypothetical protein KM043_001340 [Ampulex compressa]|nr:hypothetical protein KM043_001340 [Ampulex compressa]